MEEESGQPILGRIVALLPIVMIGMLIMGMVLFVVTSVVPRWREYEAINQDLETAKQTLAAQTIDDPAQELMILQHRIDNAHDDLKNAAVKFLSTDQAENILNNLYGYARESGVQITSLQAQQPSQAAAASSSKPNTKQNQTPAVTVNPYVVQAFRLRVDGDLPLLMGFVARIREASVAGIVILNLDLHEGETADTLIMDILLYSSEFSSGESYIDLPQVKIPAVLLPAPAEGNQQTAVAAGGQNDGQTPDATLEAVPALPTEPPLALLLSDTLDTGDLSHWNLGAGWHLAGISGGQVLEVNDSPGDLTLVYNTLNDAAVQLQVWLEANGIRLSLRQSAAGRYSVTLDSLGLVALYRDGNLVQSAVTGPSGVARWRTLRISAVQGLIRVSVDGVEMIHVQDDVELPPGSVSIAMTGTGTLQVDNIELWGLDTSAGS